MIKSDERLSIKYDFEWPKSGSDYEKFLDMKSTILTKIEFEEKKVNNEFKTVGSKFYFKDE